jgi:hypothetical protein
VPLRPFRSVFKSNLTASLRALRNAARSLNPEDLIARSMLALDPRVPYTDERRPPPLDEAPSAALRRYLNPTTSARIDPRLPAWPVDPAPRPAFTASIQLRTYRVRRAPLAQTPALPCPPSAGLPFSPAAVPPGPRQREPRENPDFVRMAVLENLMRRAGKILPEDRKPGRARLALPPRKSPSRPYNVGPDGVPERWRPLTRPPSPG